MELGFEMEEDFDLSSKFTCERAEENLSMPMSEDLPENIEVIERILGESYISGIIDIHELDEILAPKVEQLLRVKGVMPVWNIHDLVLKLKTRIFYGQSSWDFGLGEIYEKHQANYEKNKERPSVKKAVTLGGKCQNVYLIILSIIKIDEMLAKGQTYNDVFNSIVYCDDNTSNHAFLNHVEERFNTDIKSSKQLLELAQIDPELAQDVEFSYLMGLEARYGLAIEKRLRDGCKYKDLLVLKPEDFGLPSEWKTASDDPKTNQEIMILRGLYLHFNFGEISRGRVLVRDAAQALEAPYKIVLKASEGYA